MNLERKNQFWSLPRYNSKDLTPKFLCWVSFLTKEQEETRSYISIPASPNASDAQIIPAERAVYTENNKIGYKFKLNKYEKSSGDSVAYAM